MFYCWDISEAETIKIIPLKSARPGVTWWNYYIWAIGFSRIQYQTL